MLEKLPLVNTSNIMVLGVKLPRCITKRRRETIKDMCRNQAMAGSNACNLILFEPMVMSVLLGQQKQIRTLQRKNRCFAGVNANC